MARKKATHLPAGAEKTHTRFDEERQKIFLLEYSRSGRVMHSAAKAGICDETVRAHVKKNDTFAELYEAAKQVFKELLEREVYRRGIEGWQEPEVQKGQVVYWPCEECKSKSSPVATGKDKYVMLPVDCPACDSTGRGDPVMRHRSSDRMLELMLKRHMPEYRDKFEMDITTTGGVLAIPVSGARTNEDWEKEWGSEVQEAEYERVVPEADPEIVEPREVEHPPGPCADEECDLCRERPEYEDPKQKKKTREIRVAR